MKVSFGALVISAGICGILSFAFLASSLGTDYWYIIETNPQNATDFEDLTSHSGLWRINEGKLQLLPRGLSTSCFGAGTQFLLSGGRTQTDSVDSFMTDFSRLSETEMRLLSESSALICSFGATPTPLMLHKPSAPPADMHSAIVVVLPLSLVLLLFGGICGLISSLARSPVLLTGTASYFFICSLLTLCGATLYIIYSHQALAETERLVGQEGLSYIHTSFGWSLGLAWLSYALELLAGVLLLAAAQTAKLQQSGAVLTY
ncbi:transmembrane protein 235-like isoform X1 [Oryzias latipes]|uniref:transmembrane protein 235-like isoform X1 n=1 Tax=Oryzias latipes TaxID=8090 RepID=UPI0005CBE58A|nr:transmembrane protein 235-like isoform X1 [Oryzias latipes]